MLTSEIVRIAEARGLRLCSYIDDILIMNTTAQGCADDFVVLESILTELGLKLQTSKQQDPAQSGNEYLGIEIDTRSRQFRVGAERQRLIAEEIRAVLGAPHLTVGRFRSLLGRISWLSQVQRAGRSRTRPLYGALRSRRSRARVVLTAQDREDLQWFLKLLADPQWVGSRWKKPGREVVRIAKSDAGERGIGLVYRGRYAYYEFTEQERLASSHARELLAVALALELFGAEASGIIGVAAAPAGWACRHDDRRCAWVSAGGDEGKLAAMRRCGGGWWGLPLGAAEKPGGVGGIV
jgi:hypothetical protein